jgi:transcriptional regulator with XRE-family HTH domain
MATGVKERLLQYLHNCGVNNSEFGRRVGVSSAYIASIRKSVAVDILERVADEFPDLNIEWLLLGRGQMQRATAPDGVQLAVEEEQRPTDANKLLAMLEKKDEQIDRLLAIKERLENGNNKC